VIRRPYPLGLVLLGMLAALLVPATSSSGYTTVGELFPPQNTCDADTYLQTGVNLGGNSYVVPTYGAVTSWSFFTGVEAVPGLTLKVARPYGGGNWTIVGESAAGTQHPDQINTFKADILVEPGEVVGIYTSGGAAPFCGSVFNTEPLDTYVYAEGNWGTEATLAFQSPPPNSNAPYALFPVAANVSEPPISQLSIGECTAGSPLAVVTPDYGAVAKGVHYIVDEGGEQFAKANSEGVAKVKLGTPPGPHTLEYWAEDKSGDLEHAHHRANVLVVSHEVKVAVTSEQNKDVYKPGEKGSVSIKASSPYGLILDPSASHVPLDTSQEGFYTVPAEATDTCGTTQKENFTYSVGPVISKLRLAHASFVAARGGASIARSTGTTISYVASGAATTNFTVSAALAGELREEECEPPRQRLRKGQRRGKRCTRYVDVPGGFRNEGSEGNNSFHFTGRVGGRTLAPGTYRLEATPEYQSIHGPTRTLKFRILR
jgi:hypothetical protein